MRFYQSMSQYILIKCGDKGAPVATFVANDFTTLDSAALERSSSFQTFNYCSFHPEHEESWVGWCQDNQFIFQVNILVVEINVEAPSKHSQQQQKEILPEKKWSLLCPSSLTFLLFTSKENKTKLKRLIKKEEKNTNPTAADTNT